MEFKDKELETIKNALQYGILFGKTEEETAEFALLLSNVQHEIIKNNEHFLTHPKDCPFHYCANNPKCGTKCGY